MTEFPDWTAPQAYATAISTTGAPLLGFKNVLASSAAGQNIAAGTGATVVNSGIAQVGYEMSFSIATAAGTATPVAIIVTWTDSSTGLVTDAQTWTMFAGTTAAPHVIRVTGPSNGDHLAVVISAEGANAITVKYVIMQVSRVYTRHFGHTISSNFALPSVPGFTFAACDPSSGILCAVSQVVAAGGNNVFLLPLYSGTARFWGRATDATGSNSEWRLTYNAALITLGDNFPYIILGNSGFSPDGQGSCEIDNVAMPRTQMAVQLVNHNGAAANTMEAELIARELAA